jgi:membrane protein YdbS with pleckstrin-like domain
VAAGGRLRSRMLDRYVLSGERVVVATRHHWGMLLEPVATTLTGLLVVVWLVAQVGPGARDGVLALGSLWLLLVARLVWRVFEWRNEWFVATDRRLLLLYGLITHKVAMMPLTKVTDMNYGRSPAGRVLGYGQFLLESAGQDQALRQIDWVAHPEATYRQICDTLFGPNGVGPRLRGAAPAPPVPDAPPPTTPGPPSPPLVPHPAPPTPAREGHTPVPPPPVPPPPGSPWDPDHVAATGRPAPARVPVNGPASSPTRPLPVVGRGDAAEGADEGDGERGWSVSGEQRAPYVRVTTRSASLPAPDPYGPGQGHETAP